MKKPATKKTENNAENFDKLVNDFFADPNTTPNAQKTRSRTRARAGERKENIRIQNLINSKANVETVIKSPSKSYQKLSVPSRNDDGKTKSEVKKESNRNLRRTEGNIPSGSAYKKGAEKDDCNDEE